MLNDSERGSSLDPRPAAAPRAARTVITTGLHGSASTWVFNVALELMLAAVGEDHRRARVRRGRQVSAWVMRPYRKAAGPRTEMPKTG